MNHKVYIGIDPDCEKSGVAIYYQETQRLVLTNLGFFGLFVYLNDILKETPVKVIIDAGWLNKSNWHAKSSQSKGIIAMIGERTGANHEVGKKIGEMCEYFGIVYEFHKPVSTKVNSDYFAKITGFIGRTNQEQRDAAMLVWGL